MKRYVWFLLVAVGTALTMSSWAYAQDQSRSLALGVGVGYVDPEGVRGTFWLVANGRYKFASNLAVEPEIGYWRRSESVPGRFSEASLRDISVGGNVLLILPAADRLQVFVGSGPGVHFVKRTGGFFYGRGFDHMGFGGHMGFGDHMGFGHMGFEDMGFGSSDTETKFGVHLLGGVEADVAESLAVFGAGRFDLVPDIEQFKVYGGLRYKF